MPHRLAVLLMTLVAAGPAFGQAPGVTVTEAWTRATPPGASVGAAYLTLSSPAGDRLVAASSPAAAQVEVHEMRTEGGVMRMRQVEGGVPLPAGKTITLMPGGFHIMMMGLKAPLKPGDTVPLHLTFQSAPPVDVTARVAGIAATAPPAH